MKAVVLEKFGKLDNLKVEDLEVPENSENEVLVKVKAISINPVDVKTRSGKTALSKDLRSFDPIVLGWDISGTVEKAGKNVTDFKERDDVFGMINFAGQRKAYAEYVTANPAHLALKPKNITHVDAAACTLAALTAWQAFTRFGHLKHNDKVLIHAASGCVGHFAVQIAKHLGAYVIGTSSERNKDFLLDLGVDQQIDYRIEKFEEVLSNLDFVLETIGHTSFRKSVKVLKHGGTIVNLTSGLTEEDKTSAINKALQACFFMSVYSNGEDMNVIAGLLEREIIKPHIYRTYDFPNIRDAHLQLESRRTTGKVVVKM
ncbi:MAG TPA: NADP-dependent oxidoreductase [Sunxiuqinia sp.]|nr:NADP-dependent oxidoreductase [Sunxiuqinia sp.]